MVHATTVQSPVEAWFAGGERVDVAIRSSDARTPSTARGFVRHEGDLTHAVTFMPGYPDGSIGWSNVLPHLPDSQTMPKLFVEYLGMGDSDKPKNYRYSTAERTDLVEELWRHFGVASTTLVAFDFSSLVVLEHLQRRLERAERGLPEGGPAIRGVFIFNGGLFTDGHSHPWYTTPVLRRLPDRARRGLGRSFRMFKMLAGVMWSKSYRVSDAEVRAVYDAMDRHDGLFYLAAAAGFVADHKAQGDRLDFARLFAAYRDRFPFVVGGSDEDPFEKRQVVLAQERLGAQGLRTVRLPGGHLTTNEQPAALAQLVADFQAGLTTPQYGSPQLLEAFRRTMLRSTSSGCNTSQ
ncbi:MAG TPA: alpha/beta hydrolase [Candidatus Elarobacter sp.]|jgi:pimeloyl-ACP methyl ester carboxylesterase|nr:alpha/beta hydrolase [Candidatus Elarobacter sp.]